MQVETTTWIRQVWTNFAGELTDGLVVPVTLIGAGTFLFVLLIFRTPFSHVLERAVLVRLFGLEVVAFPHGDDGRDSGKPGPQGSAPRDPVHRGSGKSVPDEEGY